MVFNLSATGETDGVDDATRLRRGQSVVLHYGLRGRLADLLFSLRMDFGRKD